jgi:hypothetical protein
VELVELEYLLEELLFLTQLQQLLSRLVEVVVVDTWALVPRERRAQELLLVTVVLVDLAEAAVVLLPLVVLAALVAVALY